MPFFNREKDKKYLKAVLKGEPSLVYFIYGPINSGKTTLLLKVFEELPENFAVFYINFRWRYVEGVKDLIQVLFRVKREKEKLSVFLEKVLKNGAKLLEKLGGIPIPEEVFDLLFRKTERMEDVFAFLKDYFGMVVDKGYTPVFVLDEMQTIKEVINASGRPVIQELFNFLVGLTKETHLCHCLCSTSDCLFIEEIHASARLEGRAKYILVDDLEKEDAFKAYEGFGFKNKEVIWKYIGGKLGDMVKLHEDLKAEIKEEEALENMLRTETSRLSALLRSLRYAPLEVTIRERRFKVDYEDLLRTLAAFKEKEKLEAEEIEEPVLIGGVRENLFFYNPVEGTVRLQSRLMWNAVNRIT